MDRSASAPADSDLALIVDRWPTLPEDSKAAIMAKVREDEGTAQNATRGTHKPEGA